METPLFCTRNIDLIELLLRNKADVSARDVFGRPFLDANKSSFTTDMITRITSLLGMIELVRPLESLVENIPMQLEDNNAALKEELRTENNALKQTINEKQQAMLTQQQNTITQLENGNSAMKEELQKENHSLKQALLEQQQVILTQQQNMLELQQDMVDLHQSMRSLEATCQDLADQNTMLMTMVQRQPPQ